MIGTLTNEASGTITGRYESIQLVDKSTLTTLNNHGAIVSIENNGVDLYGENSIETLNNEAGASITGNLDGISLLISESYDNGSSVTTLTNSGTITGTNKNGISLQGSSSIETLTNNSDGTITGGGNGVLLQEQSTINTLSNSGSISGTTSAGILLSQSSLRSLTNEADGIITGSIAGIGVIDSSEIETLTNYGLIEGQNGGIVLDIAPKNLSTLKNYGTIRGTYAVQGNKLNTFDNYGLLDGHVHAVIGTLNIEGDQARITGPVMLIDSSSPATVNFNGSFTTENTFSASLLNLNSGALLNLGHNVSTSSATTQGFTNSGTLVIAAGNTPTITGSYTQTANGAFRTQVVDDTTYGQLVVDGTATLPSNAQIEVDVADPNFSFTSDRLQDIITANTLVSDGTFSVTDNSLLFNFIGEKDGNTVDLKLTTAPTTSVVDATDAYYPPAVGSAAVFDDIIQDFAANGSTGNSDLDTVIETLGSFSTEQQVGQAVAQTVPLLTAGSRVAMTSTLNDINRVIQSRQLMGFGRASGDNVQADKHFWLKPFASWADQDNRKSVKGYDADIHGLILGVDLVATEKDRIGVAFAYVNSDIDGNENLQNADVDSYQLSLYGSRALAADTQWNYQADYGHHNTDGKRKIPFMAREAKSDYDSWSVHLGTGVEKTFSISEATQLTPGLSIDYTRIDDDDYTEKHAGALNLVVKDSRTEELLFSLDTRLSHHLSDRTRLTARAGVSYDAINEDASLNSAFAGSPGAVFKTEGLDLEPWSANLGLGVVSRLSETFELSAGYDYSTREDYDIQSVSAKLRWLF